MEFEKVREITVENLGVDEDEVELKSDFREDLGADSLDLFELVMAFEDEFGVEISNDDIEEIATVEDAVNYIKSKQ